MSDYSFVISLLQVGLPLQIDTGALLADLAWFLNDVEDDATEENYDVSYCFDRGVGPRSDGCDHREPAQLPCD
jgi:hypothetical protein